MTMKTVTMRNNRVSVEEVAVPQPGSGQVLVKSLACGICGSDLHITRHAQEIFDFYGELGLVDASAAGDNLQISLGHEFCAEIVGYGPDTTQALPVGARVTSIPFLAAEQGQAGIGTTPGIYGAYSQYFILDESCLLAVPEGLEDAAVTMTEPLAVGLHAVNHGAVQPHEAALVVGCGTIGLACIAALKRQGVNTIIASDPLAVSRAKASQFGATHTVNPLEEDEIQRVQELANGARVVILECVGIPFMIPDLIKRAPSQARIVFTGVHTAEVKISPAYAMVKELNIKYSYYYTPAEYAECLQVLALGEVDWRVLLTGKVGIDGVPGAFNELMKPNSHIKVVVEPWREGALQAV